MKLSSRLFMCLLAFYSIPTNNSFASRGSSTKKRTTTTTSTNTTEQTKQDCITKYISALDKECYNANNTNKGGVYSDCSDKTITELYDVMDMQLARIVGNSELSKFLKNCSSYKGEAVSKWLGAKNIIEKSAVKSSSECIYATEKLSAAKKCYSAALAHDGNFFDFDKLMKANCGSYPEVAQKFSKAGDLGLSNIPKMLENYSTGQFTNKADNWRNAVEATLASYIYEAKDACGEENYEIIELNTFEKDSRENLLTKANESFVSQIGEQLGSRTENLLSTGKPTVGKPTQAINNNTLIGQTVSTFYENMGWKNNIATGNVKKRVDNSKFGTTSSQKINYKVKDVYIIDSVSNLNNAKARLSNIIKTGDIGTSYNQDALDISILNALGARVDDSSVYNILADLEDGDTFIVKQNNGMCMALYLKNNELIKLTNSDVDYLTDLHSYMNGCQDLAE